MNGLLQITCNENRLFKLLGGHIISSKEVILRLLHENNTMTQGDLSVSMVY